MKAVPAYEGAGYILYRREADALASIIIGAGEATLVAVLSSKDSKYQSDVRAAIIRAAEILERQPALRSRSSATGGK